MSGAPGDPPPSPPRPLLRWMEEFGARGPRDPVDALTRSGVRALGEALDRPGRDRKGAHALLAADALLTYVVEALADAEDPEEGLRALLEAVATGVPG